MNDKEKIRRATEDWVRTFNAVPRNMIEALMEYQPYTWCELTRPALGDCVLLEGNYNVYDEDDDDYYFSEYYSGTGKILEVLETGKYLIELEDESQKVIADFNEIYREHETLLPMWGTMWSFDDSSDDYWLEGLDGLQVMSDYGFRIYEHVDYGYFFGIDGAGYSFYENHWIPLYEARGLQWHKYV